MYGIQLIRLLDILPITGIRNAPGVHPRSLILTGDRFNSVETVIINGVDSPYFMAYSDKEMIAEVPEIFRQDTITDVSVLSTSITYTGSTLVNLTVGNKVRKTKGITRLMQNFLRILLRSPGSNIFSPRSGGGLMTRVGKNISQQTAADVVIAINSTKTYIVGVQTASRVIPPSERLLSADITNVHESPDNTSVSVTILLKNHAGQNAAATMTT